MLDFDGDGYLDLAIGAPHHSTPDLDQVGETDVFLGPLTAGTTLAHADAAAVIEGTNATAWQGYSVENLGDMDGDHIPELGAGSLNVDEQAGLVSIWAGGTREWPVHLKDRGADAVLTGDEAGDFAGADIAGGDLDGDGLADLAIGAYGAPAGANRGRVVLVFGGDLPSSGTLSDVADTTLEGEADGDWAGRAVAVSPDVNGDGYGDLLVGAMEATGGRPQSGVLYVVYGRPGFVYWPDSLADADGRIAGENAADFAASGRALEPAGDVNGDGLADILVGAYQNDEGGENAGKAYLLHGRASDWPESLADADRAWVGASPGGELGRAVSGGGDVDGDGLADLLLGEPAWKTASGAEVGRAQLILARDLDAPAVVVVGDAEGDQLGRHLFPGDDLDRDDLAAIGVGAYGASEVLLFEVGPWVVPEDTDVDSAVDTDICDLEGCPHCGCSAETAAPGTFSAVLLLQLARRRRRASPRERCDPNCPRDPTRRARWRGRFRQAP
jgi:hypothetical protein